MPVSKKLKILFVTPEVVPFVKTGGLADVSSALPQRLQEMGHQVRLVCPKYGAIDERKHKIHEVVRLKDIKTRIGEKEVSFSLRSSFLVGQKARVQIYFLDNEEYFASRHSLYADPLTREYFSDNDERFSLFAKAVFELIKKLGWIPDIIHCNDWNCGMVPVYQKTLYKDEEKFKNVKTLFTIHNMASQGEFPKKSIEKLDLLEEFPEVKENLINKNKVNFLKGGIIYADAVNTVSETYAEEICNDKSISNGLNAALQGRKDKVHGIVNGIDINIWNPEKDKHITKKYSIKNLNNKIENKKALADKFGIEYDEKAPIIGIISKLNDVKGMNLIESAFEELMKLDIRLVLLGTGEKKYHKFFEEVFMDYPEKFSCYLGFDDDLAHMIEAGSDMILMPSKSEPCGLNQLYSLVYGTVPIVRATGGLVDTVIDFQKDQDNCNGFVFDRYSAKEMVKTIKKAVKLYQKDSEKWHEIMIRGMKLNFSWVESAKKYFELYKHVAGK